MANSGRNGGIVNGVLKSSRDGIKVRNNLVNQGNLVCRDFGGRKEEDLMAIISHVFVNRQRDSRQAEVINQREASTPLMRAGSAADGLHVQSCCIQP